MSLLPTCPALPPTAAVCAAAAAGAVCELRVPDHGYSVASAFNDMSLHTFSAC